MPQERKASMLTQKDYDAIAKILQDAIGRFTWSAHTAVAIKHGLADRFAIADPDFDREKFIEICNSVTVWG